MRSAALPRGSVSRQCATSAVVRSDSCLMMSQVDLASTCDIRENILAKSHSESEICV